MSELTRREWLGGMAAAAPASWSARSRQAEAEAPAPAFRGDAAPRPLPFDPARLRGLSEKLIRSHWENNYGGSVRALNGVRDRLRTLLAQDAPAYVYAGLKREELARTGSVVLHELYFANLGGSGEPGGRGSQLIRDHFGSHEAWEAEFRKVASSLAGGSGWALLTFNLHTRGLHNVWAADHLHDVPSGVPLLVLDMYEHSYHMDYGSAAARYVDAFFENVDWQEVSRRAERASKA